MAPLPASNGSVPLLVKMLDDFVPVPGCRRACALGAGGRPSVPPPRFSAPVCVGQYIAMIPAIAQSNRCPPVPLLLAPAYLDGGLAKARRLSYPGAQPATSLLQDRDTL
ncbi:MAG: hypothetical protein KME26_20095 [Oscillatoria princeps RMCB-10]|nr:hypothetical protein [Oscillatoria princeps RMCB-10]